MAPQCLRACEDAKIYSQRLSHRASSIVHGSFGRTQGESPFEGQLRTRQALDEAQAGFAQTIGNLSKKLGFLVQDNSNSDDDKKRRRLQSDVRISKQCLNICNMANDVSRQKLFRIGEVVAEGDSDQVVVTTLADLFDIGKASSNDHWAQLIGSMTGESLLHLTENRHSSRFGAYNSSTIENDIQGSVPIKNRTKDEQASSHQASDFDQNYDLKPRQGCAWTRHPLTSRGSELCT